MKFLLPLKILVLIAALVGVFYAIHRVNSGSMQHAFETLGIQEGNGETPGFQPSHRAIQPGEVAFNICPNRVKAIVWSDRKVEELRNGMKVNWMAYDPAARELGYLAVEKWFSNHCQIFVTPFTLQGAAVDAARANDQNDETYSDFIMIRYIDGSQMEVKHSNHGHFMAVGGGQTTYFASTDLPDALRELESLAQFAPRADHSAEAPVPSGKVAPVDAPGAKPTPHATPKMMRATVDHSGDRSGNHSGSTH